jgi:uroporphyrinogen-III decarboxylase
MMTSRERLLSVLNGGNPDRTPICMFISDTDISDGLADNIIKTRSNDRVNDLIRFHEVLGLDILLRISTDIYEPLAFNCQSSNWNNIWQPDGKYLIHKIITPQGELKEVFNLEGETFPNDAYEKNWMKLRNIRIEALVKTADDLELIKKYRPAIPVYNLSHIHLIKKNLGDKGIILPRASSSVFNYAAGLMKLEDLLMAPFLDLNFYKDLMEFCALDTIAVTCQVLETQPHVVRIIGNIANAGIVSDKFYFDFVFPYEKQLIDFISASDGKVLFHNCGKCNSFLKIYSQMLAGHALESLSKPQTGGDIENLKHARNSLGEQVVMIGNFDQVSLLKDGTPEQIRQEVKNIFTQTSGDKKYIFSTSDSIIPGTPLGNIIALVNAAKQFKGK